MFNFLFKLKNTKSKTMKNKLTISLLLLFLCFTNSQAQGLWGLAFRGFVSGFAGAAGKYVFSELVGNRNQIRTNNVVSLYPRIEPIQIDLKEIKDELFALDGRVSHLETQIYLLDQRMTVLEHRLDKIEDLLPVGSLTLGGALHSVPNNNYRLLNGEISLLAFNAAIGLNFNMDRFEEDGEIPLYRQRNEFRNILSYLSFGSENDAVYLTLGSIYTSNFGHSFLFRNYSNDIIYNERKLGFKTGIKHLYGGVEFMSSDISAERIKTGKIFLRPFAILARNKESEFAPILTTFSYGYAKDIVDSIGTKINFQFADFLLPISMKSDDEYHFMLNVFGNWASIENMGSGYGIGLGLETTHVSDNNFASENGVNMSKLSAFYEYRKLEPKFRSGYFDNFYELDRVAAGISKYEQLANDTIAKVEHYMGGQIDLLRIFHVSGYLSRIQMEDDAKSELNSYGFRASATIPFSFGKNGVWLEAGYAYDIRNAEKVENVDLSVAIDPLDFNKTTAIFGGVRINFKQFSIRGEYKIQNYFHQLDDNLFKANFKKIEYTTAKVGLMYSFGWSK